MKKRMKRIISLLSLVAMVVSVLPSGAYAASTSPIVDYDQNVDVVVNVDDSYTGDSATFKEALKAKLAAEGIHARITVVDPSVSMDSFDSWQVYDHYYNPAYSEDGTVPSDWNDFSGRHPYFYYKESYPVIPKSTLLQAETLLHDDLWADYITEVNNIGSNSSLLYFMSEYLGQKKPYDTLTEQEKESIEPDMVATLLSIFYYNHWTFTTLDGFYDTIREECSKSYGKAYADLSTEEKAEVDPIIANETEYYLNCAYGQIQYKSMSEEEHDAFLSEFYYNVYITPELGSQAYYDLYDYIMENMSDSNFVTDITSEGSMDYIYYRDKHIYTSMTDDGNASMTFLGYSAPGFKDFMIYPTVKTTEKTVSFDVDASKVSTHTLEGAGFLVNSGIDADGYIHGYVVFYQFNSSIEGVVRLLKINDGVTADSLHSGGTEENMTSILQFSTEIDNKPFTFNSTSLKKHVTISVTPTSISCCDTDYTDAEGTNLSESPNTLFDTTLDNNGYNGYGPISSYYSHGCSEISIFTFSNLMMGIKSTPLDTLRSSTYQADGGIKKIFINLSEDSESDTSTMNADELVNYYETQARLAQDQIFYITSGGNTTINSIGGNGLNLAGNEDSLNATADYIKSIVNGSVSWTPVTLTSVEQLSPVALFDILESSTGKSVLALDSSAVGSGVTLIFGNTNKSVVRSADSDGNLTFEYKVYDPNGNEVALSGNDNNELTIDSNSLAGTYIFALTATDSQGRVSSVTTRTLLLGEVETETYPEPTTSSPVVESTTTANSMVTTPTVTPETTTVTAPTTGDSTNIAQFIGLLGGCILTATVTVKRKKTSE